MNLKWISILSYFNYDYIQYKIVLFNHNKYILNCSNSWRRKNIPTAPEIMIKTAVENFGSASNAKNIPTSLLNLSKNINHS
jgi:hypothetical protein